MGLCSIQFAVMQNPKDFMQNNNECKKNARIYYGIINKNCRIEQFHCLNSRK
jgi:hypothetical protein